jgi:drug/metabolite transporter (DMT)-like permease
LIAATSAVYGWIVMKKLVVNKHYSPILVNGVGMLMGGLGALITSFGFEQKPLLKCAHGASNMTGEGMSHLGHWFCFSWHDFLMFFFFVTLLILVANVIFYNLYGFLLKKYTPTFLSLVGLLSPAFTAFLGWIFLGETVTWHFFVSLALVSLGAYIFYKDELIDQGSSDEEVFV